jgi:elongation factor P
MSIPATQMRPGMIIKYKDDLHLVFSVEHRTPGNLRAFIQAKLRNVRTGSMFIERFRSPDPIDRVYVDEVKMEFLYNDGDDYYFMDENFEQTMLKRETLGDAVDFLTPNLSIRPSWRPSRASRPPPPLPSPSPPRPRRASSSRSPPSSTKARRSASTPPKAPT